MIDREPPRLCDDSSTADDLREMIAFAREDGPDEAQMASLLARLPAIEAAARPPVSTAPVSPALRIVPLVTVALLVGGGLWFMQRRDTAQPPSVEQPAPAPLQAPAALAEKPETPSASVLVEAVPMKTIAAVQTPPRSIPAAEVDAEFPGESASAATAPEPARPTELALLAAAREALQAEDWSRAIHSARLHERHYPDGVLGEEREAIAIEAMWKEGMRSQATVRLQQMTEDYPRSSYRKQLESLVSEPDQ